MEKKAKLTELLGKLEEEEPEGEVLSEEVQVIYPLLHKRLANKKSPFFLTRK